MCKIGLGAYFFAKTSIKQWCLMPRLEKPKENQCFWEASEPGFSDFSDFPQMENCDLGWTGLGLGSPKTLFSAKKSKFLVYFWPFPIIWGFPLGCPPASYWPLWATLRVALQLQLSFPSSPTAQHARRSTSALKLQGPLR